MTVNPHLAILLQTARAMDAAEESQSLVEAQFYGRATPLEATLALSKAKVEADKAMAQLAKHILLIEQASAAIQRAAA